jgi:uncharacterized protein (DUF2249 family)
MVRIMAALETLPPGEALHVLMDRRPIPLYAILEQRGFLVVTKTGENGDVQLTITRPGAVGALIVEGSGNPAIFHAPQGSGSGR